MPDTLCRVMLAAYALTGCDTTSVMYYIDKKTMYNVLANDPECYSHLEKLGKENRDNATMAARMPIAKLYDTKEKEKSPS